MFHCDPHIPDITPVVYLPFIPHMFMNEHQYKHKEEYDRSHLTHHELFDYRQTLYSASGDITHEILSNILDLTMRNQMRYCCTSKSAILQFEQGQYMTDEEEMNTLSSIDRVEYVSCI